MALREATFFGGPQNARQPKPYESIEPIEPIEPFAGPKVLDWLKSKSTLGVQAPVTRGGKPLALVGLGFKPLMAPMVRLVPGGCDKLPGMRAQSSRLAVLGELQFGQTGIKPIFFDQSVVATLLDQ